MRDLHFRPYSSLRVSLFEGADSGLLLCKGDNKNEEDN